MPKSKPTKQELALVAVAAERVAEAIELGRMYEERTGVLNAFTPAAMRGARRLFDECQGIVAMQARAGRRQREGRNDDR